MFCSSRMYDNLITERITMLFLIAAVHTKSAAYTRCHCFALESHLLIIVAGFPAAILYGGTE